RPSLRPHSGAEGPYWLGLKAAKALAEPFRGVTTDGQVIPGLFSLQQTGISTKPVQDAADAFIASLTAAQKKVALHPKIGYPSDRRTSNAHSHHPRRAHQLPGSWSAWSVGRAVPWWPP